jgi:hypothetical protein
MPDTPSAKAAVEAEVRLDGNVSDVVRVGDTVRRGTGIWTPAVHALLRHLEKTGFAGAPRVLGFDDRGREVLSYIEGDVRRQPGPWLTDTMLRRVGALLRELHDATRSFPIPDGALWMFEAPEVAAGEGRIICHNDIAPRNTIFRGDEPVAFIDWDFAGPAHPTWDLAHAAWEFTPLADDARCARLGWEPLPDRPARVRTIVDAYGLDMALRPAFPDTIVQRMRATADGMEARAAGGDAAFAALVKRGFPDAIRIEIAWAEAHLDWIREALLA